MDLTKFLVKKKDAEAVEVSKILKAAGDKVRRNTAAKHQVGHSVPKPKPAHAR
jgi:hypothetical protein